MKHTPAFERDVRWFLKMRHNFNFDGATEYYNKAGEKVVVCSKTGVSGVEAFKMWDSQGKITPTKHPTLLRTLLKVKGSVNLHIKMYAEDRAACNFSFIEFRALCIKWKAPAWFREAVEAQKVKYWKFDFA